MTARLSRPLLAGLVLALSALVGGCAIPLPNFQAAPASPAPTTAPIRRPVSDPADRPASPGQLPTREPIVDPRPQFAMVEEQPTGPATPRTPSPVPENPPAMARTPTASPYPPLTAPQTPHLPPTQPTAPRTPQNALAGLPTPPPGGFHWEPHRAGEGPVRILIGLDDQEAWVYQAGVPIGRTRISTGRSGFETPTGRFEILEKNEDHVSNLYEDGEMPFMQRLTWDGIALHGGELPGYPASHGCIRLPHAFAEALFGITDFDSTEVVVLDNLTSTNEIG